MAVRSFAQRSYLRFLPADEPTATIQSRANDDATGYTPDLWGLILNESASGCALAVVHAGNLLQLGGRYWIQVGRLSPMLAELRWLNEIDHNLCKVGFQYLV